MIGGCLGSQGGVDAFLHGSVAFGRYGMFNTIINKLCLSGVFRGGLGLVGVFLEGIGLSGKVLGSTSMTGTAVAGASLSGTFTPSRDMTGTVPEC